MKILHLAYSDDYGGASVAMKKIHKALQSYSPDVSSSIAVIDRKGNDEHIISLSSTFFEQIWAYVRTRLAYKIVALLQKTSNSSGRSVNIFPSNVLNRINAIDFDILHLHWIGNETIKIEDLIKIRKPILWTFHDTWAMLGAEHTDITFSERFVEGYSKENKASTSSGLDVDRWTWERKLKIFSSVRITPIAVSTWLASEIKRSKIWNSSQPVVIPNCINNQQWEIGDKQLSKSNLGIAQTQKVVAFGAINAFSDKLKGYQLLKEALLSLSERYNENVLLLLFGDPFVGEIELDGNIKVKSIGVLREINELNKVYSCADVVVVPSYIETFGQVAAEAIACGTPVVAFNNSGPVDIIRPGFNGYLSNAYSITDMADKIKQALETNWDPDAMKDDIQYRFSDKVVAEKYTAVYKELLK